MPAVDDVVLASAERLAAVARARRVLPSLPMPLDGVARLAARFTDAHTGVVTLTADEEDYLVGAHNAVQPLDTERRLPTRYSVCQYVVSSGQPLECPDLRTDSRLSGHPLEAELGYRAILSVPLRDAAGQVVGTVTVGDMRPRDWGEEHRAALRHVVELLEPIPVDEIVLGEAAVRGLDAASVLDGVQEAFVGLTAEGVVIGWNRAAEEMFGWTAEQACGLHLDAFDPPDYAGRKAVEVLPLVLADPDRWRTPRRMRVRHRDGHHFPTLVRFSAVRGRGGGLVCAFFTDDSAQLAAETEAARERTFSDVLIDSVDAGVAALDADGTLVVANRTVREMFALPLDRPLVEFGEEAVAQATMFHPDGRPMALDETPLWRALTGTESTGAEMLIRIGRSPLRYLWVNARPIRDPNGVIRGAVAVFHEVTESRRAERMRACELEVTRVLAAAASVAEAGPRITRAVSTSLHWPHVELWLADPVTDTLELTGHHSAPGVVVAGLMPERLSRGSGIGGTVWRTGEPLWLPDLATTTAVTDPVFRERVALAAARGLRTALALPICDGDTVLGVLTCFADSPDYDPDTLTASLEPITGQIGQYLARRRAEETALELARTKDDFLALVGHEMRTPLTSIATYVELLAAGADAWPATDRQLLEVIDRNTTALRAIIEDLLDLTALQTGHFQLTLERVDLAALVAAALDAAAPAAERAALTLNSDLPDRLDVHGDPHRLRQIVDNLLSNAIKYSPDGGDVQVTLARDNGVVELTVSDSGIGIPEEERHQLFTRFFRSSVARARGIPGTGLGLSIVRALVEAHGGQIHLTDRHSDADGAPGTTAIVRLPALDPP